MVLKLDLVFTSSSIHFLYFLIVQDFSLEGIRDIPKEVLLSRFMENNSSKTFKGGSNGGTNNEA